MRVKRNAGVSGAGHPARARATVADPAAEWVAPSQLVPWKDNPRKNDGTPVAKVAESISRFGFGAPIVARKANNEIIAGHTRWKAAQKLGLDTVPVRFLDIGANEAHALALADNRVGEEASWDDALLAAVLADLKAQDVPLEALGWDDAELAAAMAEQPGGLTGDPDEVPEPPAEPKTKRGDLWLLGKHRLLCGDSTNAEDVARVMGGRLADMVWTDPPYGVALNKVQSVSEAKARRRRMDGQVIENDELNPDELRRFLSASLGLAAEHSKPGACWYVAAPSGDIFGEFAFVLGREGLCIWRHTIVWVKDQLVLGRADYHYRHESVLFGWKPGAGHHRLEDRTQDTVWEIPRPKKSPEHPSMKPVELVARALKNSSSRGDVVLEPFGGSGTTLIAAETTGRECAAVEMSPQYCDVIVARWEKLTGKTAVLG